MPPTLADLDRMTSWLSEDALALLGMLRSNLVKAKSGFAGEVELAVCEEAWKRGEEAAIPLVVDVEEWNAASRRRDNARSFSDAECIELCAVLGVTPGLEWSATKSLLARILLLQHRAFPGRQRALRWIWQAMEKRIDGEEEPGNRTPWLLFIVWSIDRPKLRGQRELGRLGETLRLSATLVVSRQRAVCSELAAALLSVLFAGVVAGLLPGLWRDKSWAQRMEAWTYGWIYATSMPDQVPEKKPGIWIVNIARLRPEGTPAVTPRKELLKLVRQIADARPRAIGIDINLAPVPNAALTADDRELLDECLRLTQRTDAPPIHIAVAIDSRTQFSDSGHWLGDERYWPLAATSSCPSTEEREEAAASVSSPTDNTDPWLLPLEHADPRTDRPLPGFAAALVPAQAEQWRKPVTTGLSILPATLTKFLPESLKDRTIIPADQLYIVKRTWPMAAPEIPQPKWSPSGLPEVPEEPPHDPLWSLDSYWVSYRLATREIVVSLNDVPMWNSFTDSVVILGDTSRDASDKFKRAPLSDHLPGALCHACGVSTLCDKPILRLSEDYLKKFDGIATGTAVFLGEVLGFLFFAASRKPIVRNWLYHLCTRAFSLELVYFLAVSFRVQRAVWIDVFWAYGVILLLFLFSTIRMAIAYQHKHSPPTIS